MNTISVIKNESVSHVVNVGIGNIPTFIADCYYDNTGDNIQTYNHIVCMLNKHGEKGIELCKREINGVLTINQKKQLNQVIDYTQKNNLIKNLDKYNKFVDEVYKMYVDLRITKTITLEQLPYHIKPVTRDIHGIYLNTQNKINKNTVIEYINTMPPAKLTFHLKNY